MAITTVNKDREHSGNRLRGLTLAGTVSVAALGAQLAWAESKFTPQVTAAVTVTDNVELAVPGQEETEALLQVAPGFLYETTSRRFKSTVLYSLESYFFASESGRNESFHYLDARGEGELLDDLLSVEVVGKYGQSIIDPRRAIPTTNLTEGANLTDTALWSVTPKLHHTFAHGVEAYASYMYGQVKYLDDNALGLPIDDLTTTTLTAGVRKSGEEASRLGWGFEYEQQENEYNFSAPVRYDILEAAAEYRLTSDFWLLARGGKESDLTADQTDGGLDVEFYQGGFRWAPGTKHQLTAYAGKRFFGNSYEATYTFTGRALEAGASYVEKPETRALSAFRQLIVPIDPTRIDPNLTPISADLYISKMGQVWTTLTGRRNQITLMAFRELREYVQTGVSENTYDAELEWAHRLGPRTRTIVAGGYTRYRFPGDERSDSFVKYTVAMERQLGPRSSAELKYRRYQRDIGGLDPSGQSVFYRENALTLSFRYAFR
jgi:hypothetical protein